MARTLDFHAILKDPRRAFGTPERLLADARLDREGKRAVLRRWEEDARMMAVAEEEGMTGGEADMLDRVLQALAAIGNGAGGEHGARTKQGQRTSRSMQRRPAQHKRSHMRSEAGGGKQGKSAR